jgi:hypothetical protein
VIAFCSAKPPNIGISPLAEPGQYVQTTAPELFVVSSDGRPNRASTCARLSPLCTGGPLLCTGLSAQPARRIAANAMIFIFMLFDYVEVAETRRTWYAGDELHDFNYLLARCFDGAVFRVFRHRYDHILVLQA